MRAIYQILGVTVLFSLGACWVEQKHNGIDDRDGGGETLSGSDGGVTVRDGAVAKDARSGGSTGNGDTGQQTDTRVRRRITDLNIAVWDNRSASKLSESGFLVTALSVSQKIGGVEGTVIESSGACTLYSGGIANKIERQQVVEALSPGSVNASAEGEPISLTYFTEAELRRAEFPAQVSAQGAFDRNLGDSTAQVAYEIDLSAAGPIVVGAVPLDNGLQLVEPALTKNGSVLEFSYGAIAPGRFRVAGGDAAGYIVQITGSMQPRSGNVHELVHLVCQGEPGQAEIVVPAALIEDYYFSSFFWSVGRTFQRVREGINVVEVSIPDTGQAAYRHVPGDGLNPDA